MNTNGATIDIWLKTYCISSEFILIKKSNHHAHKYIWVTHFNLETIIYQMHRPICSDMFCYNHGLFVTDLTFSWLASNFIIVQNLWTFYCNPNQSSEISNRLKSTQTRLKMSVEPRYPPICPGWSREPSSQPLSYFRIVNQLTFS